MKIERRWIDGSLFFTLRDGSLTIPITICYDPALHTLEIEDLMTTEVHVFDLPKPKKT